MPAFHFPVHGKHFIWKRNLNDEDTMSKWFSVQVFLTNPKWLGIVEFLNSSGARSVNGKHLSTSVFKFQPPASVLSVNRGFLLKHGCITVTCVRRGKKKVILFSEAQVCMGSYPVSIQFKYKVQFKLVYQCYDRRKRESTERQSFGTCPRTQNFSNLQKRISVLPRPHYAGAGDLWKRNNYQSVFGKLRFQYVFHPHL